MYKHSILYYFLNKLQEKKFFDKGEKINKRLNIVLFFAPLRTKSYKSSLLGEDLDGA
jgi:hypothetical protein